MTQLDSSPEARELTAEHQIIDVPPEFEWQGVLGRVGLVLEGVQAQDVAHGESNTAHFLDGEAFLKKAEDYWNEHKALRQELTDLSDEYRSELLRLKEIHVELRAKEGYIQANNRTTNHTSAEKQEKTIAARVVQVQNADAATRRSEIAIWEDIHNPTEDETQRDNAMRLAELYPTLAATKEKPNELHHDEGYEKLLFDRVDELETRLDDLETERAELLTEYQNIESRFQDQVEVCNAVQAKIHVVEARIAEYGLLSRLTDKSSAELRPIDVLAALIAEQDGGNQDAS